MTRWINVQEAMKILEENYIKVSYKTFTDWLRKLEIAAVPSENRKEGWSIREEDLFTFIDKNVQDYVKSCRNIIILFKI
ncbi:hypothetical protein AAHB51_05500 [Bacillus cereus]